MLLQPLEDLLLARDCNNFDLDYSTNIDLEPDVYYQAIDKFTGEKLKVVQRNGDIIALLTPNRPIRKYQMCDLILIERLGNSWN